MNSACTAPGIEQGVCPTHKLPYVRKSLGKQELFISRMQLYCIQWLKYQPSSLLASKTLIIQMTSQTCVNDKMMPESLSLTPWFVDSLHWQKLVTAGTFQPKTFVKALAIKFQAIWIGFHDVPFSRRWLKRARLFPSVFGAEEKLHIARKVWITKSLRDCDWIRGISRSTSSWIYSQTADYPKPEQITSQSTESQNWQRRLFTGVRLHVFPHCVSCLFCIRISLVNAPFAGLLRKFILNTASTRTANFKSCSWHLFSLQRPSYFP